MAQDSVLENYTVVATENQLKGKGQQGSIWSSKPFKNLTFSVFVRFDELQISKHKYLNFAVSLAVFEVLKKHKIPNIFIKWPNDILSGNKKLCGILIENNLKGEFITSTIIGIGLNVNQIEFSNSLKKVTSLKFLTDNSFNLDILLKEIVISLQLKMKQLNNQNYTVLESDYSKVLYKKNTPIMFKNSKGILFMGIIRGISFDGKLQIELEDESIVEFGIKEISFV